MPNSDVEAPSSSEAVAVPESNVEAPSLSEAVTVTESDVLDPPPHASIKATVSAATNATCPFAIGTFHLLNIFNALFASMSDTMLPET